MKNVIIAFILMFSVLSFAQDNSNKKFQFGIAYSLTSDAIMYKNPFSFYADYQLKKWNDVSISTGLKSFYYSSKNSTNFSNKLGFNPNVSASYYFLQEKMNTYFGLGYYFDNATFKPTQLGLFTSPNQSIKTSGFTIASGLKYFVHPNIFIDTNLTIILAKTKYESGTSESNNNAYFNIGAGVAF
ncbi:MAG: hypothetical protein ACOYBS_05115 [Flavobacterium sp.]